MIYGMYLSAQGAEAQSMRQTVLANNLANANTTAFKRDIPVFRAHLPQDLVEQNPGVAPEHLLDQTGGVSLDGTITDFTQGPIKVTGKKYDVALVGQGFFQVNDGQSPLLTRNGQFTLNADNILVTADNGFPVLDPQGQPVVIPPEASDIDIAADGRVFGIDQAGARQELQPLAIYQPADLKALAKEGNSLYRPLGPIAPAIDVQVRQGAVEESGTSPVQGMMELIQTGRAFEMNINLIQSQDQMLGRLLSSMARR